MAKIPTCYIPSRTRPFVAVRVVEGNWLPTRIVLGEDLEAAWTQIDRMNHGLGVSRAEAHRVREDV